MTSSPCVSNLNIGYYKDNLPFFNYAFPQQYTEAPQPVWAGYFAPQETLPGYNWKFANSGSNALAQNPFKNYTPIQFNPANYNINKNWTWGVTSESKTTKKVKDESVSLSQIENAGLKFLSQKYRERWDDMDTTMQKELLKLVEYGKTQGITIYINSGFRTEAEQQELIAQGAPAAKKGSKHLTGRAVDIKVSGNKEKNLAILGKYWRDELGHRWGADFKRPKSEPWHFDIG